MQTLEYSHREEQIGRREIERIDALIKTLTNNLFDSKEKIDAV